MFHEKKEYRSKIPCPVCKIGWRTTSGNPILLNHIKGTAKGELLAKHLIGKGKTPHADWLRSTIKKENFEIIKQVTLKVGKAKFAFKIDF